MTVNGTVDAVNEDAPIRKRITDMITGSDALQILALLVATALVGLFFSVITENFLTGRNMVNIARQMSMVGIVAVGVTIALIAGNVDLAVGSVAGLTGVVLVQTQGFGIIAAISIALTVAVFIGVVHGFITTRTGIHSLIVTLATLTALRGLTFVLTGGFPMALESRTLQMILWQDIGPLPLPFLIYVGFVILGYWLLTWTPLGTSIYATGGNKDAAAQAGIDVRSVSIITFVFSALCSGTAGIVLTARLNNASPLSGDGWELTVIAAVVIGGTSLFGGRGRMAGTVLGILLLTVIANGMNLRGISSFWQMIVEGLLILVAVGLSTHRDRRSF